MRVCGSCDGPWHPTQRSGPVTPERALHWGTVDQRRRYRQPTGTATGSAVSDPRFSDLATPDGSTGAAGRDEVAEGGEVVGQGGEVLLAVCECCERWRQLGLAAGGFEHGVAELRGMGS